MHRPHALAALTLAAGLAATAAAQHGPFIHPETGNRYYLTPAGGWAFDVYYGSARWNAAPAAVQDPDLNEWLRSIIADTLASGELQSCTARTAWARLLNRPMSADEQRRVLPALVRDFEASGRSYRALVRAIVTSPAYRRID